jgi:hypothetical protein
MEVMEVVIIICGDGWRREMILNETFWRGLEIFGRFEVSYTSCYLRAIFYAAFLG